MLDATQPPVKWVRAGQAASSGRSRVVPANMNRSVKAGYDACTDLFICMFGGPKRLTMKRVVKGWYAARCVFRHGALKGKSRRQHVYEERIVLVQATSGNEAIRFAEKDAGEYAGQDAGITYLHYVETYHLFAAQLRSGVEVFSLLRSSNRSPARFLSRYYDDGSEHRRNWARGGRRTTR